MRLRPAAVTGAAIILAAVAAAPGAGAEGLGGVSGWSPSTPVCGEGNLIPILIGNTSSTTQIGSITVPTGLAANVQIFTSQAAAGLAQGCGRSETMTAPGYSINFTVAPNQSTTFWAVLGGVDYNAILDSHVIGFGGLPSGTSGQGWYDMQLNLSATESFQSVIPNYSQTGGTNGSNQNNFNLVECNTANGNVALTGKILTPYTWANATAPAYKWGDPICAAWAPQGTMVQATVYPQPTVAATAAQINGPSISFAGTASVSIQGGMTVMYQDAGYDNTGTWYTTNNGGYGTTYQSGNEWAVVNIPLYGTSGTVYLACNGTTIATYTY